MSYSPEIAVVGCGAWGQNIVRTLAGLGALRCVVDISPSGRKKAADCAPGVPIHAELTPVLEDPGVKGLMVAVPIEEHYRVASRALAAGKHTFVEKPLTLDLREARALIDEARRVGRILMVGHLLEYHPAILKLDEMIKAGELGELRYLVSNRLNLGVIRTTENALWSFAPHDIAVILRLLGKNPIEVVATGGSYVQANIADTTITQLLFDSGVRAHIFVSWLHPYKEQRLVVIGSKRMASFDDVAKKLVIYDQRVAWKNGQPVPTKAAGTPVDFSPAMPLEEECIHFIECVSTGAEPRTSGDEGLRVLEILHAAQRSLMTNGRPVALSLEESGR